MLTKTFRLVCFVYSLQCQAEKCHYEGLKYRNYFCIVNGSTGIYFDRTKCDDLITPEAAVQCYKTKGCQPNWVPVPWGEVTGYCSILLIKLPFITLV